MARKSLNQKSQLVAREHERRGQNGLKGYISPTEFGGQSSLGVRASIVTTGSESIDIGLNPRGLPDPIGPLVTRDLRSGGWYSEVLADLAGETIADLGVPRNRRTLVRPRVLPPRVAVALSHQFVTVGEKMPDQVPPLHTSTGSSS